MNEALRNLVEGRLRALEINPFEAAKRVGLERGYLNDILIGRKDSIRDDKKPLVAAALGVPVSRLYAASRRQPGVRVLGYVGAGSQAHFYRDSDAPNEWVEAPDNATEKTVAVQIRGDSLGPLFDGWYAYYDNVNVTDPPSEDLIGRVCVCGLSDGRVLIKKMKRGQGGSWTLLSNADVPIYDAPVEWAAKVIDMRPASALVVGEQAQAEDDIVIPQKRLQLPVSHVGKPKIKR